MTLAEHAIVADPVVRAEAEGPTSVAILSIDRSSLSLLAAQEDGTPLVLQAFRFPFTLDNAKWAARLLQCVESIDRSYLTKVRFLLLDSVPETLIPEVLFRPLSAAAVSRMTYSDLGKFSENHFDRDQELGISCQLILPEPIENLILEKLPPLKLRSNSLLLIRHALRTSPEGWDCHICYQQGTIDMQMVHDGKLLLTNHFQVSDNNDVLYYFLAATDNLELKSDAVTIRLSSCGPDVQSLSRLLKGYCKSIMFDERAEPKPFPYDFQRIGKHLHISLFELLSCV